MSISQINKSNDVVPGLTQFKLHASNSLKFLHFIDRFFVITLGLGVERGMNKEKFAESYEKSFWETRYAKHLAAKEPKTEKTKTERNDYKPVARQNEINAAKRERYSTEGLDNLPFDNSGYARINQGVETVDVPFDNSGYARINQGVETVQDNVSFEDPKLANMDNS
jgi:hypothetical protein